MDKILKDISAFVNQCLSFLGAQPTKVEVQALNSELMSNVVSIIIQLIATFILFLFVKFFLWKKITNLIDARQKLVQESLDEAKANNQKSRDLLLERDTEFKKAKEQAKKIIEDAARDGKMQKEQIIEDAKREAKRRLSNADAEVAEYVEKSKKEIKDAVVDVAFAAAEKIVKREIDREKHQDIVKEFIEEVGK